MGSNLNVEFEILPLAESSVFIALDKFAEDVAPQTSEDFLDVRLEKKM